MTRPHIDKAKMGKILAVTGLVVLLIIVWCAKNAGTAKTLQEPNLVDQLLTTQQKQAEPYAGVINLLVVGYDETAEDAQDAAARTDMILYMQWDCEKDHLEVLQVPPSLYVGQYSATGRINAVVQNENGLQGLCDVISGMTGMPVDGYLAMDLGGLGDIVEYIGGLEVNIPQEIENGGSHLPKGQYLLDRNSVEFLVRERRSYADGDIGRQRVLRNVFAGLLRYAQSCTPVDAAKLVPVIAPYLQTSLDMDTLLCLAASAEKLTPENVIFSTPSAYSGTAEQASVIFWDPKIIAPLLRVRFGYDCDPEDLNLPDFDAESREGESAVKYLEGSSQKLSETAEN